VGRERVDLAAVIAIEIALVVLAIVARFVARHRWNQIDWMMCRRDRAMTARGA